ncbi:preprotein translocase subunit SecY [archaeon]|nr:preprotein translocase subunit SecY [archaeon]
MTVLDLFEPVYKLLPEIKPPEVQPVLKKRILWTCLIIVLFFIMGNIGLVGLDKTSEQVKQLEAIQIILASPMGSLISAGIGPIVLASIILQLLMGAGIIKINLSEAKDKARFTSMQKLFAIILAFFEAGAYTGFGIFPAFIVPLPGMVWLVVLQIALGSILLMYLDEIVSKYGFGSGIGLFIAGGVASTIFWRVFAPPLQEGLVKGLLLLFIEAVASGQLLNALVILTPVIFTLLVFFVVVWAEGIHVNIPITMGASGFGGRYPVKFLYVSNIPVILAAALFANIQLWSILTAKTPLLGQLMEILAFYTKSPHSLIETIFLQGVLNSGLAIFQALIYLLILIVACVIFGKFWVEMGGQGTEQVAEQLSNAGMYIPGFRRDKRVILSVLERYIPPITILGSMFVGLLAGFADLTGALGTGTGILLTVGIVYRLYEELAKQQVLESNVLLQKLVGGS